MRSGQRSGAVLVRFPGDTQGESVLKKFPVVTGIVGGILRHHYYT